MSWSTIAQGTSRWFNRQGKENLAGTWSENGDDRSSKYWHRFTVKWEENAELVLVSVVGMKNSPGIVNTDPPARLPSSLKGKRCY